MAEQAPAEHVAVAAVDRVREQPLARVLQQRLEEGRPLDLGQHDVLHLGRGVGEGDAGARPRLGVEPLDAAPVELAQPGPVAGHRRVDVVDDPDLGRARPELVGREDPLRRRGDRARLVGE